MEVMGVTKVKEWVGPLLLCAIVIGIVGLVVAMIVAGVGDIFTEIDYVKWAIWGAGIGVVIGLVIGVLIKFWDEEEDK